MNVDIQRINVGYWTFHLGNALLFIGFLGFNSQIGLLVLRLFAVLGFGTMAARIWLLPDKDGYLETAIWSAVFAAVNFVHLLVIFYRLRPIKFSTELEMVYKAMFVPLRVSRSQFKKITEAVTGTMHIPANHLFVEENRSRVENLTLVLDGSFAVTQGNKRLHVVKSLQFLDSPEWYMVVTDHPFQVTMTSLENSTVIMWHRDRLKLSIMRDQFLQAVFDHIVGRDVVRKLLQVSDTLSTATMLRCEKRAAGAFGDSKGGNGIIDSRADSVPNNKPVVVVHRVDKPGQESVTNHVLDSHASGRKRYEEEPLLATKPDRLLKDEFTLAMDGLMEAIGRDSLATNFRPFVQHDVIRTTNL
ncbi:unnamed protein product [Notodromas monacha]|uniref:POPDC1-3 domain-containing protein n=1 Tax=Notodromas monacha TaxID=399045 RepID=A0A7R9BE46_9CRUS|nr:unnamed protein product [Notodromas monacha]CAG0913127.1 unnamed protein product [Notodromas monacha]